MTREEFDVWIEEHYNELLKVAKNLKAREPEDVVQVAVLRALESDTLAALPAAKAWPWMTDAVRSVVFNNRRSRDRQKEAHRTEKIVRRAGAFSGWKRPAPRAE